MASLPEKSEKSGRLGWEIYIFFVETYRDLT